MQTLSVLNVDNVEFNQRVFVRLIIYGLMAISLLGGTIIEVGSWERGFYSSYPYEGCMINRRQVIKHAMIGLAAIPDYLTSLQ